jgi:hypothetical protein
MPVPQIIKEILIYKSQPDKKMKIFRIAILIFMIAFQTSAHSQLYFTKSGRISFTSRAPLEDIESVNKTVDCLLNSSTGSIQFSVLIKGFEFQKALMQEHFNENYMESNKYPRAAFKGTIINNTEINYSTKGTYKAVVKGELTIRGISKAIETTGTVRVNDNIEVEANFNVPISDYNISIPTLVKDKVANSVKVSVQARLEPYKK